MPGFNRSGPMGNGPITGRGMGVCTGATNNRTFFGRGIRLRGNRNFGLGYGARQGFGFNQNQNLNARNFSPEEEKQYLSEEKEYLLSQISDIDKKLEEL